MKKVTKSFLSVLLCMVIVFGAIPFSIASAEDSKPVIEIKNLKLTVYEGEVGEIELEVSGDNVEYQWQAHGTEWLNLKDNHMYSGTKTNHFKYRSNVGWAQNNDWYGKIPFRCKVTNSKGTTYTQEFMFNFLEREKLSQITLTGLKAPIFDAKPNYDVKSNDEAYTVTGVSWFGPGITTNSTYFPPMSEESTFRPGDYECYIFVEANGHYKLDSNTKVSLGLPGDISVLVVAPPNGQNGMDTYIVKVCFTVAKPAALTGAICYTSAVRYGSKISIYTTGVLHTIPEEDLRYKWQISKDGNTWEDIPGATEKRYTPSQEDIGNQIRLVISALGYVGEIVSDGKIVNKGLNTNYPVVPQLKSVNSTSFELANRQENQEYVFLEEAVKDYSEIDWSSNIIPEDNDTVTGLPSHSLIYVYTRIKPTESEDTLYVARSSLSLNDGNYLSNIVLEGYTSYGEHNKIYIPLGGSVTLNIAKNPINADVWSNFKFKTPYTTSLVTISPSDAITSGKLPESLTITAGDTVGGVTMGAYYNDVALNYGTWNICVYDPENLPADMLKLCFDAEIPDLILNVGDSATPQYDEEAMKMSKELAEQFKWVWQVCKKAPDAAWETPQFGEENEYVKVDPDTGLVTSLGVIPDDASYLYKHVYLFAEKISSGNKTQIASCNLIIRPENFIDLEGIAISSESLQLTPGETAQLDAYLLPANANANNEFVWSSSDPEIVLIDENGTVKAVKDGSAVITAIHTESGFEASCNVTVSSDLITELAAVVSPPIPNSTPDMSITVPDSANYSANIEYWCKNGEDAAHLSDLDTFKKEKTYIVCVKFTAKSGHMFANDTVVTLNREKAIIEKATQTEITVTKEFVCSEDAMITYGDVNNDGDITMLDVVMVQKNIAKLIEFTDEQSKAADVNGDGEISMEDVVMIQKYIAHLIDSFKSIK